MNMMNSFLVFTVAVFLSVFAEARKSPKPNITHPVHQSTKVAKHSLTKSEDSKSKLYTDHEVGDFYTDHIQRLFDHRCLACHSCYNAPCQLNLQSYEGYLRGANKLNVYGSLRTKATEPTRMWIDAKTSDEWRKKSFYEVNTSTKSAENLFFQMLNLRSANPHAAVSTPVSDSQTCPSQLAEFKKIEKENPELGMPYGFPPLKEQELKLLQTWIENGSPGPSSEAQLRFADLSEESKKQIHDWEKFLNQDNIKQKIVSRYIYEHLFLAHIYFKNNRNEFFRLIRSSKACDKGPDEIATRRPNDAPGIAKFYYCLRKFPGTIVLKTHLPYEWSPEKLNRYNEIFFAENWFATEVPSYKSSIAENPFIAFKDIPVKARYKFLLEDAQYEVSTFIKGPVCNGSMAVNSIQEQFYVFFLKPESDLLTVNAEYEKRTRELLVLPGMFGSDVQLVDTPKLSTSLEEYREKYRELRANELARFRPKGYFLADIWDGDQVNDNAVLTVFRHDQNAVVMKGAQGDLSKTAFVVDYPILERLVYNLAVNFDVFGSISHQLLTRIYMDLIRMEAEELFLAFLPPEQRLDYRRLWYRGFLTSMKMNYIFPTVGSGLPTGIRYTEEYNTKKQFVEKILFYLLKENVRGPMDVVNWKSFEIPTRLESKFQAVAEEQQFQRITSVSAGSSSPFAKFFPDVAYVMIKNEKHVSKIYTLIHQKEHENISWIIGESLRMAPEEDNLSLIRGFWSSYPNMIFEVPEKKVKSFVDKVLALRSEKDYEVFVNTYGIKRQNPRFWSVYDDLNLYFKNTDPVNFGYLDLTRYEI